MKLPLPDKSPECSYAICGLCILLLLVFSFCVLINRRTESKVRGRVIPAYSCSPSWRKSEQEAKQTPWMTVVPHGWLSLSAQDCISHSGLGPPPSIINYGTSPRATLMEAFKVPSSQIILAWVKFTHTHTGMHTPAPNPNQHTS